MKQRIFYREYCYVAGLLAMALGAACMTRADFGLSMIVAPAYLLYAKVSEFLPFFTFGFAEAVFQIVLLALMCLLLRRFRVSYLFSFVTAVLYGLCLDTAITVTNLVPYVLSMRILLYLLGMVITSAGVAFFFKTYIAPEVYELFVRVVAQQYRIPINRFKTGYDIASCLLSVAMSFAFFGWGRFVGVQWGTVICALVNGTLIGWFCRLYERLWKFEDRFPKLRTWMP